MKALPRFLNDLSRALLDLANEQRAFDALMQDLETIRETWNSDERFRHFFSEPQRPVAMRQDVLRHAIGRDLESATLHALLAMIAQEVWDELPRWLDRVKSDAASRGLFLMAHVTTSVALTDREQQHLQKQLATRYKTAIRLEERVDAALLGGYVVDLGDQRIDASLRGSLSRLREVLAT